MANPIAEIQIHAALIDDYLYIQDQPVVPGPGRFVAVQDIAGQAPVTHLFTLDSNGNLLHFRPDTTSHSGWTVNQVPHRAAGSIQGISALFHQGVLDVLVSFFDGANNTVQLLRWTGGDSWSYGYFDSGLSPLMNSSSLGRNRVGLFIDSSGGRYLYGAVEPLQRSAEVFLGCYDESIGIWCSVSGTESFPNNYGATYWMEEAEGGGVGILNCDADGGLEAWFGSITNAGGPDPSFALRSNYNVNFGIGSTLAPQLISLPGQSGADSFLIIDSDGNLFQTNGSSQILTKLTGGANAPAGADCVAAQMYAAPSAKKTTSSNLAIFLVERDTQRLWLSRQNGVQRSGVPAFGPWVPLGNQLEAITCAPYVAGNPEVFTVDLKMNMYRMAQDANDTIWTTRKIASPTPKQGTPRNIASNMMNIQTVGAAGTPVGGALLTVTVTTPSTLIANQLSYLAEPSAPAVIPMDVTGSAAVYCEATTVASNRLYFSVVNSDGSTVERWCEGDMVEVKSNETPPPPRTDSVAEKLAGVTQTDLQEHGLLDPTYSQPKAAVQAISSVGKWMVSQSTNRGSTRPSIEPQAWRLDLRAGSGPAFHTLTSEEAAQYFPAGATRLGGFFGDVWGDIVHGLKHFWDDVTSVVATLTDDGINFAINLGKQVVHFVVTTARQAAAAAELVFAVIKQAAKRIYDAIQAVIAWLKLLFDWNDIINTHKALRTGFNQFMTMMTESISTAQDLVKNQFDTFSTDISQAFDDMANDPLFGNSFNQYVGSIQSETQPLARSGLDGGMYNTPYQQHSTRIHYVYHHAKNHFANASSLSLTRLGDLSALTDSIQKNWNPDGSFPARADAVRKQITPTGISQFFDLVMRDVLLAIKSLALSLLQGAKEIITVMLGLLKEAVTGLQSVLNASIDIPVISYIYNLITGDDLSILDLLCLILAVPVTILYKVIFESAPFSSDSANQLNGLTWPWLTAEARSLDAKSAMLRSPVPPQVFVTMGVTAGFCNLVDAYIATACDSLAFADNPPELLIKFLSWTNIALGVLRQFFGAPWKVFIDGSWSTAQKWSVANWAGNIVPLAANTIFTSFTGSQSEFKPFVGPILNTGFGLGLSALGLGTLRAIAVSGQKNQGWAMANSIVPRPIRIFKLCILLGKEDPETAPLFAAILVVADALFGYGGTVTQIGAAVAG